MSRVIDTADAIVAELVIGLAADEFSMEFTPTRRVLPKFELSELDTLQVTVVPAAVEVLAASRAASQYDIRVDIGIQKRVSRGALEADVLGLCDLVDEIADFLKMRGLSEAPTAHWRTTQNEPIYSAERLLDDRTFISVLALIYVVIE